MHPLGFRGARSVLDVQREADLGRLAQVGGIKLPRHGDLVRRLELGLVQRGRRPGAVQAELGQRARVQPLLQPGDGESTRARRSVRGRACTHNPLYAMRKNVPQAPPVRSTAKRRRLGAYPGHITPHWPPAYLVGRPNRSIANPATPGEIPLNHKHALAPELT